MMIDLLHLISKWLVLSFIDLELLLRCFHLLLKLSGLNTLNLELQPWLLLVKILQLNKHIR